MNILFLLSAFLSSYFVLVYRLQEKSLRLVFIKTCIFFGLLISLATEILSFYRELNLGNFRLLWVGVTLINIFFIAYSIKNKNLTRDVWERIRLSLSVLDKSSQLSLITVGLILAVTLTTAIISAPNNWDSMTYHLPRVMHWIQNQSVYPYPTNMLRQISFPPGASYLTLQFILLAGNDNFANCVQWIAFLGSIICLSLITRVILEEKHQWIGAFLAACLPMAIMQSTTCQNDLVTGFWLLCYTYFIFKNQPYLITDVAWGASAFGLAILTKPTALIYGIPLSILFFIQLIRSRRWKKILLSLIIFLGCSLWLALPHFLRNKAIFDNYLGIDTNTKATIFGIPQLLSSSFKNILINLPLNFLRDIIYWIHQNILFIKIDDPAINFGGRNIMNEGSMLKYITPHEDFVSSPIYFILFILGVLSILWTWLNLNKPLSPQIQSINLLYLFYLAIAVIVNFLLFSGLLKWAVFHNRLLLPIFLLSIPVSVFYVRFYLNKYWQGILLSIILVMAVFYALTPIRHPLIALPILSPQQMQEQSPSILTLHRSEAYFSGSRKELKQPYQNVVNLMTNNHCRHIGFAFQEDTWEYPLWVLLKNQIKDPLIIKNINVKNLSKDLPAEFADTNLCAIISNDPNFDPNSNLRSSNQWQIAKTYSIISPKIKESLKLYLR